MATTTNFGWETPDDTDLVKDGALAMRTLGNAIDASLVDLKGGTTGQVLSKTSNTDMDFTWVTSDDANAIQNAIVDAKGDLITATAADTPARLAVGNNGETLVADSSTSTGLRYANNYGFSAGKNKLINGDFRINQRSFSSTTSSGTYGFDRWLMAGVSSVTYSAQTFTAGAAPVAGYEAINFARIVTASQSSNGDYGALVQRIEDVRTFAGQTVTVSFWAKASTGTPKVGVGAQQNFGSGGSAAVVNFALDAITISTSWTRYTSTFTVPSISGKTIGTGSNFEIYLFTSVGSSVSSQGYPAVGLQNATIDMWGVQAEVGSVATGFQTATGTLQGELAACQRYYFRATPTSAGGVYAPMTSAGIGLSTTSTRIAMQLPVTMRVPATTLEFSNVAVWDTSTITAITSMTLDSVSPTTILFNASVASGLTQFRPYFIIANNSTSAHIGIGAEL